MIFIFSSVILAFLFCCFGIRFIGHQCFIRPLVATFLVGYCFQPAKAVIAETPLAQLPKEPIESSEGYFSASDGERFSWKRWSLSAENTRAILIAIPGMGGTASEIAPLGEFLQQKNIAVYALNLRGQGSDPIIERRGRELNVEQLLSDIRAAVTEIRQRHPNTPLFVYGESMGALLVIHLLNSKDPTFPVQGAILAAPVIALASSPSPIVRKLIRFASNYYPSLRISPEMFKTHASRFSHDPDKQRLLENDPNRKKKFAVSYLNNMGILIDTGNQAAEGIYQPVLVLGAGEDDYVDLRQLNQWFERIRSPDKTFINFPHSYHQFLLDQDQQKFVETILRWLDQRNEWIHSRSVP